MNAFPKDRTKTPASPRQSVPKLIAFLFAYILFGSVGFITSVFAFLLSLGFQSARARRLGQHMIHYLFRFFVWYLRSCRLVDLQADDLASLRDRRSLILVANHPSLLDAVFIAAYLPNVFCLMKATLVHNLVVCGQSRLAGYVNNKSGVALIRACQSRLAEGSNILVFPEGTRTHGDLGRFKMGFALLSRSISAPVHTLLIRYSHDFLGKGCPFFRPPPFPLTCSIRLGKSFPPEPAIDVRTFGITVEDYLRAELSRLSPPTSSVRHEP